MLRATSGCWRDGHVHFLMISVTLFPLVYVACCTSFSALVIFILTSFLLF